MSKRTKIANLLRTGAAEWTAWLLFLFLIAAAAYRHFILTPWTIDGYLLYLPGTVFLVPLGMLAICSRRRPLSHARLSLATLVVFSQLLPVELRLPKTNPDGYRLVSLNIQSDATKLDKALEEVKKLDPDFVCLQEIWNQTDLERAVETLSDYTVLGAASQDLRRRRFNDDTFVAVKKNWSVESSQLREETAILTLSQGSHQISVVSVHAPRSNRLNPKGLKNTVEEQITLSKRLFQELADSQHPIVLAGDFNSPECGPAFKVLSPRFHSSFRQAGSGLGLTFPGGLPVARIDHVLGTREVQFTSYQTRDFGSDHLGIVVDFKIP